MGYPETTRPAATSPSRRGRWRGVSSLLLLPIAFVGLVGCGGKSDEDVLRGILKAVAEAAEAKDVAVIRGYISERYRDREGRDRNALRGLLLMHFLRAETVSVYVRRSEVKVDGRGALVRTNVILARGKRVEKLADLLPEAAEGYHFAIRFEKEGKQWRAVSADWQPIGLGTVL